MIRDLGPLNTHWKKCMCVSRKPISKCSCYFWILFSDYPEFCHFEIMCWLCSATTNHYLGLSCEWADLFWLIISLLDFYTPLGNEIETKTAFFQNAGVGPFLTQEASWSDTYFSRTILTLSIWGRYYISFLMHLVSIFTLSSRFSVFGNWSFRPSNSKSLSEWRERLVLLFSLFQKPWFGACVHTGSVSARLDAMFLRGGDLIVTKVAAKRRNGVN